MSNYSFTVVHTKVSLVASSVSRWLSCFVGGVDGLMTALATFMVLECITSIMVFASEKSFSKVAIVHKAFSKVLIIILVGVAHTIDLYVIGSENPLRIIAIIFYLSTEGTSIIQNAKRLGIPIPEMLASSILDMSNSKHPLNHTSDTGGDQTS